ncbi:MAG TPA: glycosyltransferase, partial [Kiritimatiellia bacterium]
MSEPLVSVVIPTFNRAHTIRRSVDSVIGQTWKRWELIVVDDGSTDDTAVTLKSYGAQVRYVTQANAGPGAARNKGIELASGEFVAFLDSDDTWHASKLQKQMDLLRRCPASVACCLCNISLTAERGQARTSFGLADVHPRQAEALWRNVTEVFLTRFVLFNQAAVVRTSALRKAGLFDTSLRLLEDYDQALRLSLCGDWAIIDEPLVTWNPDDASSLTRNADELQVAQLARDIVKRFGATHELSPSLQALTRRRVDALERRIRIIETVRGIENKHPRAGKVLQAVTGALDRLERRVRGVP